ncbi:MAG: hypothetical protein GY761_03145 [Hyphomicrobiales bacterium]|nr:hypothetical protein [Hyphomicrobiales bacterium]
MFEEGDKVRKPKGYSFDGVIVSVFQTLSGNRRYVVEHETITGMLHIFNGGQLELRQPDSEVE